MIWIPGYRFWSRFSIWNPRRFGQFGACFESQGTVSEVGFLFETLGDWSIWRCFESQGTVSEVGFLSETPKITYPEKKNQKFVNFYINSLGKICERVPKVIKTDVFGDNSCVTQQAWNTTKYTRTHTTTNVGERSMERPVTSCTTRLATGGLSTPRKTSRPSSWHCTYMYHIHQCILDTSERKN